MSRYSFIYGLIAILLFNACGTEKEVVAEGSAMSYSQHPYIAKFHKALRYKASGRGEEAIKLLEECLKIRQDDDAVYYVLSQLELERDNLPQSSIYIEKAAALDPENTWYIQELAYMYFETQRYDKSVDNFKKLVEIEPRNVDWLYGYAEALVRNGQALEAIEALSMTEDQIGKYPDLSVQKYRLYMSLNKEEEAVNELLEAKKEFPADPRIIATLTEHYFNNNQVEKAISMLEELVNADPDNGRAHLTLAEIYRKQNKREDSYRELKLAFRSSDVDIDTKMQILINIHESSYKVDPEVYELIKIMEEEYPTEAKTYSIKGDFLLRAEDESGALAAYKKALEFDKTQYPIWNQVLIMLYQQSDHEELFKYSSECLTLYPTISTVYLFKGLSANQLDKHEEAIEALSAGKELVMNDKPMEAEFYGQLGEAYFGIKEFEMGTKNYDKALELSPESLLLKNNYAFTLASNKRELEKAESLIKQITEAAPEQPQYLDTYGWVLFQKGKYLDAKSLFTKAYELDSGDRMIMEHLGDVHSMLNNSTEAVKWWKLALELDSDNERLQKKINEGKYHE